VSAFGPGSRVRRCLGRSRPPAPPAVFWFDPLRMIGLVHRAETESPRPRLAARAGRCASPPAERVLGGMLCRQPGPPALFLPGLALQPACFVRALSLEVHQPEWGVRTHFAPRGCRAPLRRGGGRAAPAG